MKPDNTYTVLHVIPFGRSQDYADAMRQRLFHQLGIGLVEKLELGKMYTVVVTEHSSKVPSRLNYDPIHPDTEIGFIVDLSEVEMVHHRYRVVAYEEMPTIKLAGTALEEIKRRIKSKIDRIKFDIWKATR